MTTSAEFTTLTSPFRPELLAHCYRMLGSIHDAEDLVQETYVRAWRSFGGFEGRSSLRRWMYAIATRACLTALERMSRRPLPSGLGPPEQDHRIAVAPRETSVDWLQPAPDQWLQGGDPAAVVASRAGIRLAFVAALQYLPARQRAVLVLRDVLAFSTRETAEVLDTTSDAVDAALRRARSGMASAALVPETMTEPPDAVRRDTVSRYVSAFERSDSNALVELLRADVEFEMPPTPTWFSGRPAVIGFLSTRVLRRAGQWRAVEAQANGQSALVFYAAGDDGRHHGYGVQVLTLAGPRIARITAFNYPALVPVFGNAPVLSG